jgi:predicted transcriptional regulator
VCVAATVPLRRLLPWRSVDLIALVAAAFARFENRQNRVPSNALAARLDASCIVMHDACDEEVAMPKGFTVRLDDDQAEELEAVAKVDGLPVAEEIRQAIAERIEQRRNDEQFRARLRQSIEDNQKILDRLAR